MNIYPKMSKINPFGKDIRLRSVEALRINDERSRIIKSLKAWQISDSRGKPTIKIELKTDKGVFQASVPSGTSKGKHEAVELKALKAVKSVNQIIAPRLIGKDPEKQKEIDNFLIKLDGTKNKSKLGANAILAVSIAVCRAGAKAKNLSLWKYISRITKIKPKLPKPSLLLIEGGLHGNSGLDFQEFMVVPEKKSFSDNFQVGKTIHNKLKKILEKKFGKRGAQMGMEGGFSPPISDIEKALGFVKEAIAGGKAGIGLDCAASNFKKGKYNTNFYQRLAGKYPIIFLEDPFGEEDWREFQEITKKINKVSIIGDDLLTTNVERMKKAGKKRACNGTIIKPNQIGTITETLEAVKLAKSYGWKIMVSHRSGETNDDFIADLAAGVAADFIKTGGPTKKERKVKYKRLIKIEKEIRS